MVSFKATLMTENLIKPSTFKVKRVDQVFTHLRVFYDIVALLAIDLMSKHDAVV